MVDPAIVAGAGVVATVVAAAAYSYLTGNESSVDLDDDGEDELTFSGDEPTAPATPSVVEESKSGSLKTASPTRGFGGDGSAPTPEDVQDIGENLTEVKGIGDTRADDLRAAGFETAADLYYASDENLTEVDGIGAYTVEQIRSDIGGIGGE